MSVELKSCPFCGIDVTKGGHISKHKKSCYFNADLSYPDEGLERWNIRPIEDALQRKLDIAKEIFALIDNAITDDLMENGMPINPQWDEIYRKVIEAKLKFECP